MVEYTFLVLLIAIAAIVSMQILGTHVSTHISNAATQVSG